MKPSVIVWDLETVPDLPGFAASNDLVGKSDADIREALAAAANGSSKGRGPISASTTLPSQSRTTQDHPDPLTRQAGQSRDDVAVLRERRGRWGRSAQRKAQTSTRATGSPPWLKIAVASA